MINFYILDDEYSTVKVLEFIIEKHKLGEVIGISTDSVNAAPEIIALEPSIVLIDFLMPTRDGISIVREVSAIKPEIFFIMLSQVSDKEMVQEAYKSGIEFFINKPINVIEVKSIIERVIEKIKINQMVGGIREMITMTDSSVNKTREDTDNLKHIKYLLGVLGIHGEKGSHDILEICVDLLENSKRFDGGNTIDEYSKKTGESSNTVKQKIRRAVKKGLTNIANMGLEDSTTDIFNHYAQLVFDFESIKAEMDFIRGEKDYGGKVNIYKFLEGLILFNEMQE